ncbi:hypothetical protein CTDIVETGP_1034 [Clostridium tyrobutyricum DIVETGP]|uniref:Uncharacterized protein n=1 Tax=Clostridium tyrobutyricum DIVETGP TaxID=1408889 RepID=W6N6P4_CLOTY|nr:hypothetical protein CTDIVETGP_1034 [Clostridium tyrobutyricum DIVETGP]
MNPPSYDNKIYYTIIYSKYYAKMKKTPIQALKNFNSINMSIIYS